MADKYPQHHTMRQKIKLKINTCIKARISASILCLVSVLSTVSYAGDPSLLEKTTDDKVVYLTYDDGPESLYTPHLLDVLKKHQVKATFFVTGLNVETYPDVVKRAFQEGHIIANHSYAHKSARDMTGAEFKLSIEKTDSLIRHLTAQKDILFRAPYLHIADSNKSYLCKNKRNSMDATMVGKDWETQDPDQIIDNLMKDLKPEAVILLHDDGGGPNGTRMGTVAATDKLIPLLRAKGYRFGTAETITHWQLKALDCPEK
ncbi:polysaccharide deacetylase family protein [Temperatibacter marinus]|uniref:Chitooligosaccharide deacetylase n=1 Tax=Temperatibacter marinus TaxID=1456591 RepID=A0AA52HAT6_9PROT|nr:polysaccharide deacetylase family protein [Temperatibacter marinus]WND02948.1 polysaccharide deacetylase family protein [Temperatibacter marinus]